MNSEIKTQLEQIAYQKSNAFCMSCYCSVSGKFCPKCHSDDLARELKGVGVDWSVDFIIEHILSENLTAVDLTEAFEESVRSCYPEEISVGWMTLDSVTVMKEMDPVSWSMAQDEYVANEESEGNIISLDGGVTYYWTHEVEEFITEFKNIPF